MESCSTINLKCIVLRGCIHVHVWQVHNGVKFPDFLSQNEKTEEQKRGRAD